jgi:hypothetical protein
MIEPYSNFPWIPTSDLLRTHWSASSLRRRAGRPYIASLLVQNHRKDPSFRVAFEVDFRVDNLVFRDGPP